MDTQTPTAGDNLPPAEDFDDLKQRSEDLAATANRWLTERGDITDEDMAGACSDFIEQVNGALKKIEAERKTVKQPHLDKAKAVDARYNPLKAPLEAVKKLLEPRLRAWLQKKEAARQAELRRQQEEAAAAERAAQEAQRKAELSAKHGKGDVVGNAVAAEEAAKKAGEAQRQAKATAQDRARTKGDFGKRATALRVTHKAEVADPIKVLTWFYGHGTGEENRAIFELAERLASARMRATKGAAEIPGARHKKVETAA